MNRRIAQYIKKLGGFRNEGPGIDRFGMGKDQRGVTYNPNAGSIAHEVGHALQTPVGSTLREHQQNLGKLTTKNPSMPQIDRYADENAAYNSEPLMYRRAGVGVPDNAYKYYWQGKGQNGTVDMQRGRDAATATMNEYENGIRKIDQKGKVVPGTSIDAKINSRQT
jgi:hypothetical protein